MMNIMNPPADWSTLKKLIWLRGTPITGGEELTVSGTPPLSLANSLGKPLKAWSVEVSPYQDLHGYDAPWPAGGGKNLLDINNIVVGNTTNWSVDVNGDILTVTHKTAYTTGTPSFALNQPSGTYVVSIGSINLTGQVSLYVNGSWAITINNGDTFTIDAANTNEIKFSAPENQVTIITKIQIESGSTVTSYAPYSNICPISGTDKVNLFVEESYDPTATPKAVITLPQTVYTGTIGSEGGESRSGYKVFDGSSDEVIRGYSGNRFTIDVADYTSPAATVIDSITASYLKTASKGTQGATSWLISGSDNGLHQIMVNFGFSTVDEMRAYLAEHPLEVVYPLNTPTEFTVPSHTIPTPTGTATTWATAEDGTADSMSVTYVGKA